MGCIEYRRDRAERCHHRKRRGHGIQPTEQRRELHSSSSAEYRKFVCNDGSRGGSGYGNGVEFWELTGNRDGDVQRDNSERDVMGRVEHRGDGARRRDDGKCGCQRERGSE